MKKLMEIWENIKLVGWLIIGILMYLTVGMFIVEAIKIVFG